MNSFIETMKNFGETENGAVAYNSTQSALLDAFGSLGAMKDSPEEDIINIFSKAYDENPNYAMKLLFYMRDIREGQGDAASVQDMLSLASLYTPRCPLPQSSIYQ